MAAVVSKITPPARSGVSAFAVIALVVVAAALTFAVWGFGAPLQLTVDGVPRSVSAGTTIADLAAAGYIRARVGVLYKVDGGIASIRGGGAPQYRRNGRDVVDSQQVYPGDVIVSSNGADLTERVVSARLSIDPTATIQGTGPILRVVRQGRPGVELVRKGAVSGDVVSRTVLVPAVNIVLAASSPSSTDKLVALTFDDGPWPNSTLKIISILKQEGVPGTFFELGQQVQRTPQLSAAVIAAGDSIGNHSWSHPFLTKLKPAAVRKQLTDTIKAVKNATGVQPTFFRPPYGAINHNVWAQAKATHQSVVLWDVDSLDWTRPGVAKIVHNVTSSVGHASIVLMHDGGGDRTQTAAALPIVIAWLKAHGYTFVTVAQMEAAR